MQNRKSKCKCKFLKLIIYSNAKKNSNMKRLDLLITHEHLLQVNEILHKHKIGGMTFYDVRGRGSTDLEPVEAGRGIMRMVPEFTSSTKIEVVVADSLVKPIVHEILNVLRKTSSASGKIFVSDITEAYDIETNGTGDAVLK
jgi:nitrogen regulatory protein P-II 1